MNRREFLKISAAAALASGLPASLSAQTPSPKPASTVESRIRLGAPVYHSQDDIELYAREHRRLGYRAAYSPNVRLQDTDRIAAIRKAFQKEDVQIAEVGVWNNLMDLDSERRKENRRRMVEGLALADALGARCVVNVAGSLNPKEWSGPHKDNFSSDFFDAVVEYSRAMIDEVKPKTTFFSLEIMGWSIPHNPDSYLKLIRAVDRKQFGVHFDPTNMINSVEKIFDTTTLLNEAFDKLGKHIVSCHAKDIGWVVENQVHFVEVMPTTGELDYRTFLKRLAALPQEPPLMIEHLANEAQYLEAADRIRKVMKEIPV
jgi:sugar phosphate isomerase/epimerase